MRSSAGRAKLPLMVGSPKAARCGVALLAAVFLTATGASARAADHAGRPVMALSSLEHAILADANAYRRRHGLSAVQPSALLTAAARQHSQEMAADGYFDHSSAGGRPFWQRLEAFYPRRPQSAWSVGENLLWSSPGVSAARALELWERSPEHRAILLTASWREVGVSAVHTHAARGVYRGLDVTIVTMDFGAR